MSNPLRLVRKSFKSDESECAPPKKAMSTKPTEIHVKAPCSAGSFLDEQSQQIIINLYIGLRKEGEKEENLVNRISSLILVSAATVRRIVSRGKCFSFHFVCFH